MVMKNLISFVAALLLAPGASSPFAEFGGMVQSAKTQVDGFSGNLVTLMLVILGLSGIVGCAVGYMKYLKGEHGSDNVLLRVGLWLIVSDIVIFAIVKAFNIVM